MKKGTEQETSKKRTRKTTKFQRSIQGATLENILAKRNQKPEVSLLTNLQTDLFPDKTENVDHSELLQLLHSKIHSFTMVLLLQVRKAQREQMIRSQKDKVKAKKEAKTIRKKTDTKAVQNKQKKVQKTNVKSRPTRTGL